MLGEVIEEESVVAAYPQAIVDVIVGQGSYVRRDMVILPFNLQSLHLVGVVHIEPIDPASPCADPQYPAM